MMAPIDLGPQEWLSLITHVKRWLGNLLRARAQRKQQSTESLRVVVIAVRKTTIYLRHLREGSKRSRRLESELALLWTDLAFAVEDIGLDALAKRCNISGRYWADPADFDDELCARPACVSATSNTLLN
jgi:hypothetical protein